MLALKTFYRLVWKATKNRFRSWNHWRSHERARGDRTPYSGTDRSWDLRKTGEQMGGVCGMIEENKLMCEERLGKLILLTGDFFTSKC